mgnify:CR=1 FL=1
MFGQKKKNDNLLGRILLVVDGSDPSIAAVNYAVKLASQCESTISAVYVVDTATMDYLMQMRIFVEEERSEFEQDLERTGKRYLQYAQTQADKVDVELETMLRKGNFHKTILQLARQIPADIIVMGGWHRTITRKDATSRERQLIMDEAGCPVLVIKAEKQ